MPPVPPLPLPPDEVAAIAKAGPGGTGAYPAAADPMRLFTLFAALSQLGRTWYLTQQGNELTRGLAAQGPTYRPMPSPVHRQGADPQPPGR